MGNACRSDTFHTMATEYGLHFTDYFVVGQTIPIYESALKNYHLGVMDIYNRMENTVVLNLEDQTIRLIKSIEMTKNQIRARHPGGIQNVEKMRGESIHEILESQAQAVRLQNIKSDIRTKIFANRQRLDQQLNEFATLQLNRLIEERPNLPMYEALKPDEKIEVRDRAIIEYHSTIQQRKAAYKLKIDQLLNQEFGVQKLQIEQFMKIANQFAMETDAAIRVIVRNKNEVLGIRNS